MKAIKVDEETYELLRQLSEKTNRSIKDIATQAIKAYYAGTERINIVDKEIEKIEGKWITLKYPGRCTICGKELKPGEVAYYEKYHYSDKTTKTRLICEKCYYSERITDKALVEKYLKVREYRKIIQALKKQADELADRVIELRKEHDIYQILREIKELVREGYEALDILVNPEVKDRLEKFMNYTSKLQEVVEQLQERIEALEVTNKATKQQHVYKWRRKAWR